MSLNSSLFSDQCQKILKILQAEGTFVKAGGKMYFSPSQNSPAILCVSNAFMQHLQKHMNTSAQKKLQLGANSIAFLAEGIAVKRSLAHLAFIATDVAWLNLGSGNIIQITKDGYTLVSSLTSEALFVDEPNFEPIDPYKVWSHLNTVNGNYTLSALYQLIFKYVPPAPPGGLTHQEQVALLVPFWASFFIRSIAPERMMAVFVGPPACGKTDLARSIGYALYGSNFDVSGSGTEGRAIKDLAAALAHSSYVAQDEVNAGSSELMNLLARSATGSQLTLSSFHETLQTESHPLIASIALCAHQPKFLARDDIQSRSMVFRFQKPKPLDITPAERKRNIIEGRPRIFAETIQILCMILQRSNQSPKTRFHDWENSTRVACYMFNLQNSFEIALDKLDTEATLAAIDTDPELEILHIVASLPEVNGHPLTAEEIFQYMLKVMGCGSHRISNPNALARLLKSISTKGRSVVRVEKSTLKGKNNVVKWILYPQVTSQNSFPPNSADQED